MNLKSIFIGGLTLLFLVGCASAASAPTLPAMFYGTAADENGNPLPAGTVITAELNGETFTYTITETGKIGGKGTFDEKFLIEPTSAGETAEITITANGKTATQKVQYTSGGTAEINLVFPRASENPAGEPAANPTEVSTAKPTEKPTTNPTEVSTAKPTEKPTANPTEVSTAKPTEKPTTKPTEVQITKPTESPTVNPTQGQTQNPTGQQATIDANQPTETATEPAKSPLLFFDIIAGFIGAAALLRKN